MRESEARHRLLLGSWAQAVWEPTRKGWWSPTAPGWRAYTGQTLDEWLGYGWLAAVHPDDRAYAERHWREAIAARRFVNAEFRLRSPDGGYRWTNVRAVPVLDAEGRIEKWAGMNIDIIVRRVLRWTPAMPEGELQGRTILLVEDEFFQAREMKAVLEGAGATVVGQVGREGDAKALLNRGAVDAALLDINLGGAPSYATAEILHREGMPFAFLTGYDPAAIPAPFAAVPCLSKPTSERLLIRELSRLL